MQSNLAIIGNANFLRLGQSVLALIVLAANCESAFANTVTYLHTDVQGTVILETDQNRNVVQRFEYEPYGLPRQSMADTPGYTGHVHDAGSGLVYMQQRYYDPEVGQFLSIDPVGVDASSGANFNRYWYGNNNPYRYIDPDGQISIDTLTDLVDVAIAGGEMLGAGMAAVHGAVTGNSSLFEAGLQGVGDAGVPLTLAAVATITPGVSTNQVRAVTNVGEAAVGRVSTAGRSSPDFVVTPRGEAIRVPAGATGPTPTRAPGHQYTGGSGGNGLDSRVTGVRIMDGNGNQGPRAVYMNRNGQTVDPSTGRTVANNDPAAHHYLER